jgi:predicted PurR-regulated permease PerM
MARQLLPLVRTGVAFGVIGLFIRPVVLAVAYTLLVDWVSAGDPSNAHGRRDA